MKKNIRSSWFNNSVANLLGGGVSAIVGIVIPALIGKAMDGVEFSMWNLAMQVIAYVNLLSLGIQSAGARAIAHSAESAEAGLDNRLSEIHRSTQSLSRYLAFAALFIAIFFIIFYPYFFRAVPEALCISFRLVLFFFSLSAVFQILSQPYMAIFQGLHKNYLFVFGQSVSKLISVILIWIGVKEGLHLPFLAALFSLGGFSLWPLMIFIFRRNILWSTKIKRTNVSSVIRSDLLKYCGTLSVWSISTLLVNSIGIFVVGIVDFHKTGAYAVAMTASTIVIGVIGAVLSPMMTTAAALYANSSTRSQLPNLLRKLTGRTALAISGLVCLWLLFCKPLMILWLGPKLGQEAYPLALILVPVYCYRNIMSPYALMLMATGLHKRAMLSAIFEAIANIFVSIFFGIYWGVIGVAIGAGVGAILGIGLGLLMNLRSTKELTPDPLRFMMRSMLLPIFITAPVQLLIVWKFL